jgi:hypothetical protein
MPYPTAGSLIFGKKVSASMLKAPDTISASSEYHQFFDFLMEQIHQGTAGNSGTYLEAVSLFCIFFQLRGELKDQSPYFLKA